MNCVNTFVFLVLLLFFMFWISKLCILCDDFVIEEKSAITHSSYYSLLKQAFISRSLGQRLFFDLVVFLLIVNITVILFYFIFSI